MTSLECKSQAPFSVVEDRRSAAAPLHGSLSGMLAQRGCLRLIHEYADLPAFISLERLLRQKKK